MIMTQEELSKKVTDIYMNLTCGYKKSNYKLVEAYNNNYVFAPNSDLEDLNKRVAIVFSPYENKLSGKVIPEKDYDEIDTYNMSHFCITFSEKLTKTFTSICRLLNIE